MGKLSGSRSNLTALKSKFGSCLGLKDCKDCGTSNADDLRDKKKASTAAEKKDEKKKEKSKSVDNKKLLKEQQTIQLLQNDKLGKE